MFRSAGGVFAPRCFLLTFFAGWIFFESMLFFIPSASVFKALEKLKKIKTQAALEKVESVTQKSMSQAIH